MDPHQILRKARALDFSGDPPRLRHFREVTISVKTTIPPSAIEIAVKGVPIIGGTTHVARATYQLT